jgi:hypothetical protein
MDDQPIGGDDCFREEKKGNIRVRLHEIPGERSKMYVLEVSAYSNFAEDWKILDLIGSFDLQTATALFEKLASGIRGYSWVDDELLLHGEG